MMSNPQRLRLGRPTVVRRRRSPECSYPIPLDPNASTIAPSACVRGYKSSTVGSPIAFALGLPRQSWPTPRTGIFLRRASSMHNAGRLLGG